MVEHAIKNNHTPNQTDSQTPELSELFSDNKKELEMQNKIMEGLQLFTTGMTLVFSIGIIGAALTLVANQYIIPII
jgi:hypothetical protein